MSATWLARMIVRARTTWKFNTTWQARTTWKSVTNRRPIKTRSQRTPEDSRHAKRLSSTPVINRLPNTRTQLAFLEFRKLLRDKLNCFATSASDIRRFVLLSAEPPYAGVTTIAASLFYEELDAGSQCIWLDLDDVASTDDLFEQLLDAISRKQGVQDWLPVLLERDSRATEGAEE
jgi:ATP/maltotriose-dependent transcriptional regulator MalT